jgi:hypothetical protein
MVDALADVELSGTQVLSEPDSDTLVSTVVPDAKIARYRVSAETAFA